MSGLQSGHLEAAKRLALAGAVALAHDTPPYDDETVARVGHSGLVISLRRAVEELMPPAWAVAQPPRWKSSPLRRE